MRSFVRITLFFLACCLPIIALCPPSRAGQELRQPVDWTVMAYVCGDTTTGRAHGSIVYAVQRPSTSRQQLISRQTLLCHQD